jgi:hypothetical protein
VLVIDEAYALHEGMYGAPAPSTRSLSACKCSPRPAPPSPQVRRARHRHDRLQGSQLAGRGHRCVAARVRGRDDEDAPRGQSGAHAPLLA